MFVTILLYFVIACVCSFFVAAIAIVVMYPFWSREPVFHSYDFWRYLYSEPYIIQPQNKKSPYKNPWNAGDKILTEAWSAASSVRKAAWYDFTQVQMSVGGLLWAMPMAVVDDALSGQAAYLSLHYGAGPREDERRLEGALVSRAASIRLYGGQPAPIHFLDWLCTTSAATKKTSYELMHTHTRAVYSQGSAPVASIFCKEGDSVSLAGVVALLQCRVVVMSAPRNAAPRLPAPFVLREQNDSLEAIDAVYSILRAAPLYDLVLLLDRAQLQKNLRNRYFFLSTVAVEGAVVAFYLGRRRFLVDEDTGGESIEVMGSWYNRSVMSRARFLLGFLASLHGWRGPNVTTVALPVLGDNADLQGAALNEGRKAWYLHNMCARPVSPERAFVCV